MKCKRLLIILLVLIVLTPLGLWLPQRLGAGDAWGEWGAEDLGEQVGFVPRGLARLANLWPAPVPDYAPRGWEERPLTHQSAAYIMSALLGTFVVVALMIVLGRLLVRKGQTRAP